MGSMLRVGNTYIVPPYQRNYSWEKPHFSEFWADVSRTFTEGIEEYFLGSIVINNSQPPDLIVIDGQQRLITTAVLIAALRSHLKAKDMTQLASLVEKDFLVKSDYRHQLFAPSLELNKTDRNFYESHIFHNRPIAEMRRCAEDVSAPPSNRLLADCFCYMYGMIEKLIREGRDTDVVANAIIDAINNRIFVIRIDVKDDYNAFALFETLNDRGLELSEADLLKNHLLSVSGPRLGETQGDWELMEQNLSTERVIKFVRHHWLSTRGAISARELYSDIKATIRTPEQAIGYAEEICHASEAYAALCSKDHHLWSTFPHGRQAELRNLIETIDTLRAEQILVVLLAALEYDRKNFGEIAAMLVNFTFRYSTICNLSPSNLMAPFIRAAGDIRDTGRADAASLFRKHLAPLYPDDSQFHSGFSRKIVRSNAQARYILRRINDYLSPNPSLRTQADPNETCLEHILPKRFGNSWEADRRDFPGGADKYVYRLGNMTLISARLNERLGNGDFARKKKLYADDCLEITRRVLSADKWTAEEITSRQNWLASIACRIWRYPDEPAK